MFKTINDVEDFEQKLNRMFKEVHLTDTDLFDIYELGRKIGLSDAEIESMYWHLRRGDILEKDGVSDLVRFSGYGVMLQTGQIQAAYAPI